MLGPRVSERMETRTVAAGQQKSAGFSLVELLFVVAIVLILAAVAVPMFNDQCCRLPTSRRSLRQ